MQTWASVPPSVPPQIRRARDLSGGATRGVPGGFQGFSEIFRSDADFDSPLSLTQPAIDRLTDDQHDEPQREGDQARPPQAGADRHANA